MYKLFYSIQLFIGTGIETLEYDLIFPFFDTRSLPRQYINVCYTISVK